MNEILSVNSLETLTTLLIVILIMIRSLFFLELKIPGRQQFYYYYIVLSIIITVFEIPLDILVTNIIESWSDLKLSEKIKRLSEVFTNRERFWAIYDFSHLKHTSTANVYKI